MKQLIGIIMILVGVFLGLYVGVWWAFIGGIVDVIEAIRATDLVAMDVAIGVAKVMLAGPLGGVSAMALVIPGYMFVMGEIR